MSLNNRHEMIIELQEANQDGGGQRLVEEFKREHCSDGKSPLKDAGWFSRLLFNWMHPKFEVRRNRTFLISKHLFLLF